MHRLFVAEVARHPARPAVIEGDTAVTYGTLLARAELITGQLVAAGGESDLVAIRLPRGADVVVATLGVLAAGAAYLPLNVADDRAAETAAALRCRGTIDDAGTRRSVHGHRREAPPTGESAAYVLNTSGSTGWPKPVAVSHTALLRYLRWLRGLLGDDLTSLWLFAVVRRPVGARKRAVSMNSQVVPPATPGRAEG